MANLVIVDLDDVGRILVKHQYNPATEFCECGDGDVYSVYSVIEHQIALISHMNQRVDSPRPIY